MQTIHFNTDKKFVSEFIGHIGRRNMIPIIGSGFTKDCKTITNSVPDSQKMKKLMIKEICTFNNTLSLSDFEGRDLRFSQIADYFYRFVPKEKQHELIREHFIGVILETNKQKFLKVNWPYIYTLNIDDGIERNSSFNKVLPYKKLTEDIHILNCVFKLHGDAFHEITYPEEQNIIFSREQYIKSLEKNKTMLSLFQSDYSDKNIIFIGCSLEDELDLSYIITTNNNISDSYVLRIFVTNNNIDPIRKLELEQFGINTILIIDNYSEFYLKIFDLFDSIKIESDDLLNDFKNLKVEKIGKSGAGNKRFLQGFNIFNNNGTYYLPDFVVKREITKQVLEDIYSNTLTLVIGRRVSGKTILMLQILQSIKDKDVYFFPSDVSLSSVDIKNALSRKNSVILFDSNSISYQDAHNILNNIDSIKKNNSSIIFAINSSDRLMFALLSSPEHIDYYEIPDKLGKSDTDCINKELSKLGLTNLISNQTIIENFFRYSNIYSHDILNLPTINIDNVTNYDLKIFIILASMDKIYSILFHILGIQYIYAEECLRKYEPALQKEYPTFIELHQHSGFKAISNCRSWIYLMLSSFTKDDKSVNRIALNIYEIVESIHENPKYSNIYKNIILFDTLNQIFYKKEGGVIKLIFLIYKKLENLLYEEGHYWLQRAKSILYLRRNDEKSLQKALDYAKKSHYDSSYDLKLKNNSTLTIAQILGRLSKIHKYKHDYLVGESIKWYYDALQKNRFNKKYVDNVIAKARKDKNRNDLYSLISHLLKRKIQEPALRRHAEWLVNLIIIKP